MATEDKKHVISVIHPALLIAFSEYLGYVSPYIEQALDMCKGNKVEKEVQSFLCVEAKAIYRDMIKTMTMDEITGWYDVYYPIIFKEYDDKLKELNNAPV